MDVWYIRFINGIVISWKIINISIYRYFSTFSSNKSIGYTSKTKLSPKVNFFIVRFKLKDFFSINKKLTIISIMQTQAKFCVCFTKINAKLFPWWTKAFIISERWTFISTKELFLQLLAWDDLLSWTIISTKNYNVSSNAIIKTPNTFTIKCYSIASFSLLFTTLVAANNQFLNVKLSVGFLGQARKS